MVRKIDVRFYFNISGTYYLIAAPLHNGLFSLEDGRLHYDAQVDANIPQEQNESEGEDEVNIPKLA
jgi:nitrite reductase/ring-hydroxylating ferredoxin subunit